MMSLPNTSITTLLREFEKGTSLGIRCENKPYVNILGMLPKVHVLRSRRRHGTVLKTYGCTVLKVQFSLGALLRTTITVTTLLELSLAAIYESA